MFHVEHFKYITMQNIKTQSGFLSHYGFSCGYTETRETDTVSLTMWKEHGVFHVQHLNYNYARTNVNWNTCQNYTWETFDKFSDAKVHFFAMCDKLSLKRIK